MKRFLLPIFMLGLVWACGPQSVDDTQEDTTATVDSNASTEVPEEDVPADNDENIDLSDAIPHILYDDNAFGISIGQKIADIELPVEKTVLETGEGSFDIYEIKLENGTLVGYLHPDTRDASRVGQIVVDFDNAQTEEGIQIGTTFGELKEKISDFEVHGSEIESQVNVFYKGFAFQLDHYSSDYNLDPSEIPDDADVIEIAINGKPE